MRTVLGKPGKASRADHLAAAHISVERETDVVLACQKGRALAGELGFDSGDQVAISIAISEVTRNILDHAGSGVITLRAAERDGQGVPGLEIVATDHGPGIPDVDLALRDGYTTGAGLGVGLPGAKRLMDEIEVRSSVGNGTTVIMKKWVR